VRRTTSGSMSSMVRSRSKIAMSALQGPDPSGTRMLRPCARRSAFMPLLPTRMPSVAGRVRSCRNSTNAPPSRGTGPAAGRNDAR
jgi:hypothetical protein